ncbi:30S ribosomal protein S7 [Patescibacteria group bacterium]|nr:30S ribosomal protein S7 [Patescibacteria group bacterium]
MPRKARSVNRHLPAPDPKYGNVKYGKFINYLMQRGKKNVAQKIFYQALDEVTAKMSTPDQPIEGKQVFEQALKNVSPLVEIKGRRIGGANYQVPMEVIEPRKTTLGMKWLIAAAQARKGAPMHKKLAAEIMDAYNKLGAAIKKREDTHRMAEANKAFAHFARFSRR